MGIKLVDRPITETTENGESGEEGEGSELWGRNRLHPWRIRLVAAMMAVALVAGVATFTIARDTKPAGAADYQCIANQTPLINAGLTYCIWGANKYYPAMAYQCQVGYGRYKNQQYPSLRTCMDGALMQQPITTVARSWYSNDLYKYWRMDTATATWWYQLLWYYVAGFRAYGVVAGPYACTAAVLTVKDPVGAAVMSSACSSAYLIVTTELGI